MIELIKFSTPNCGPCRVLQPVLEHLAEDYKDKPVKFTYIDATEDMDRTRAMGIKRAPTVIIFKDGVEKARFEGAKFRSSDYAEAINNLLNEV